MKDPNRKDQTNPIITKNAGKVYESISESTAIAIQDATDNLRNINTIATTAFGVAVSQFLSSGVPDYYALVSSLREIREIVNDDNYLSLIEQIESIIEDQEK